MLVFVVFVIYPGVLRAVAGAQPDSYVRLFQDPVSGTVASVITVIFSAGRRQPEDGDRAGLSGFFVQQKRWIQALRSSAVPALGDP